MSNKPRFNYFGISTGWANRLVVKYQTVDLLSDLGLNYINQDIQIVKSHVNNYGGCETVYVKPIPQITIPLDRVGSKFVVMSNGACYTIINASAEKEEVGNVLGGVSSLRQEVLAFIERIMEETNSNWRNFYRRPMYNMRPMYNIGYVELTMLNSYVRVIKALRKQRIFFRSETFNALALSKEERYLESVPWFIKKVLGQCDVAKHGIVNVKPIPFVVGSTPEKKRHACECLLWGKKDVDKKCMPSSGYYSSGLDVFYDNSKSICSFELRPGYEFKQVTLGYQWLKTVKKAGPVVWSSQCAAQYFLLHIARSAKGVMEGLVIRYRDADANFVQELAHAEKRYHKTKGGTELNCVFGGNRYVLGVCSLSKLSLPKHMRKLIWRNRITSEQVRSDMLDAAKQGIPFDLANYVQYYAKSEDEINKNFSHFFLSLIWGKRLFNVLMKNARIYRTSKFTALNSSSNYPHLGVEGMSVHA